MTSRQLFVRASAALALITLAACNDAGVPAPLAPDAMQAVEFDRNMITPEMMAERPWITPRAAYSLEVDPAAVTELVVNGSFEINGGVHVPAFAGWTTVPGPFAANWYADNGGGTPVSGFPEPPPPHGAFAAVSDEFGQSNMALFQNIAVPANLCKPLKLSFMEWHANHASIWAGTDLVFPPFPKQNIRVDVMNPAAPIYDTGAGVIQNVYLSANPDPFIRTGYVPMSATLPVTLGGQTIRLRFAQVNTQFFQQVGIDNVSLTAEPDVSPPTISLSATGVLWPPNHKMVKVASGISATDDCGVASFTVSVSSNEPVDGLGDGDTAPDWEVVAVGSSYDVYVRAERSGTGTGRVYTITAIATDLTGNTTTSTATVKVPHNK
ncbi:MAG TPA: hypothetical protein VFO66_03200 [Gemmatimonadaceae bacterium]|nr:hypothetical protein [Gemmatimonadaceae bacterium]